MNSVSTEQKAQIIYFGHGGGPLPLLKDPGHQSMIDFMTRLPTQIRRPDAILIISAHWEEHAATLMTAPQPGMFYDYYGFPEEAYSIQYPAPGNPDLAARIADLLGSKNIPSAMDAQRGFDHGMFIPLMLMYPDADIPCLQISLLQGLNAGAHLALGRGLSALNQENILVVGSGFSFHNMRAFFSTAPGTPDPANEAFQDWLIETCSTDGLSQSEREQRLVDWDKAPSARYCHPREEHLLPLHVCMGMAGSAGKLVYDDQIIGKRNVGFLWQ